MSQRPVTPSLFHVSQGRSIFCGTTGERVRVKVGKQEGQSYCCRCNVHVRTANDGLAEALGLDNSQLTRQDQLKINEALQQDPSLRGLELLAVARSSNEHLCNAFSAESISAIQEHCYAG